MLDLCNSSCALPVILACALLILHLDLSIVGPGYSRHACMLYSMIIFPLCTPLPIASSPETMDCNSVSVIPYHLMNVSVLVSLRRFKFVPYISDMPHIKFLTPCPLGIYYEKLLEISRATYTTDRLLSQRKMFDGWRHVISSTTPHHFYRYSITF